MKITKSKLKQLIKEVLEEGAHYELPPIPRGMAYPDQDGIYPMLDDDGFPIYEYRVYRIPKYKEFFDWLRSNRPQGPPQLEPEPEEPYFDPDPQPAQTYAGPMNESLNEGNIPDEQAEAILRRAAAGKGGYPASQRVIKIYRSLSPEDKTKFNK